MIPRELVTAMVAGIAAIGHERVIVAAPEPFVVEDALAHEGDDALTKTPWSGAPEAVAVAVRVTVTVVPETVGVGSAERP